MRRFLRYVRKHQAGVAATAFVLVVGGIVLTMRFQEHADHRLQAIRARGFPASLAELSAWYKAVPPERNAAMICTRAFAMPCFPGETNATANLGQKNWLPAEGDALSPADLAELEKFIALCAPALELLKTVPENPEARYPLDFSSGFAMLLPHVPCFKRAMRLFEAEMLVHSAQGQTAEAVAALQAAERVRATLDQEPIFISKLVAVACKEILVRDIHYLVNAHRLSPDELNKLRSLTRSSQLEEGLARGLVSERAFGMAVFDDPSQIGLLGGGGAQPNAFGRGVLETLKVGGVFSGDRAYYLDQMSNYIHAAEQPFPVRWQLGKSISDNLSPKKYYVITRMLMPSLGRAFVRHTEEVAHLRTAETALAVEAFRRENSETLPATLQDLTPRYLSSVPIDPFDGNPLRYRKGNGGYTVYSVASDLKDNGGISTVQASNKPQSRKPKDGDLCFSVGRATPANED